MRMDGPGKAMNVSELLKEQKLFLLYIYIYIFYFILFYFFFIFFFFLCQ